jgi:hypothetical protein
VSERSIGRLAALVEALPAGARARFEQIFDLVVAEGQVVPPVAMHDWIAGHFGSVEAVRQQRVIRVTNKVTHEGALFNEIRARRPQQAPAGGDADLEKLLAERAGGDFCHPEEHTPADVFGRIRGRFSTTAANVAKGDGWHGVIIFDEHHPLRFNQAQVFDYVDTAQAWLRAAHEADPEARYPFFIWNCLWRSGASILHGHAQVTLTRGGHYAKVEALRQAAGRYRQRHGSDYFADLAAVHRALGLALDHGSAPDHGSAIVLPSLTPFKEMETHVIAPRLDDDLKSALYLVLRTFIDRLGVQSFNLALYQPPLAETPEDWSGFPYLLRIISRGDLSSKNSDIGAMEIFAQSVVATDPFHVAGALAGTQREMDR